MLNRLSAMAAVTLTVPAVCLACPACYSSLGSRLLHSYYLSTIVLSILPFAIVCGLIAAGRSLRRRFRDVPVQESWSPHA
jgi:hypothetical protein